MTGPPLLVWRLAVAVAAATATSAGLPVAAYAHGGTQTIPDAAYYRTELSAVIPALLGVTARVDPGGEWVEVTNTGTAPVIVLGYGGEPYLRVTATEVAENRLSESTYLNRSLFADSVPTGSPDAGVPPVWQPTGATGTARWHDHRIHWMGQARPPAVATDPRHPHPVGDWVVHATAGGVPFEVRGRLRWIGKPASADPRRPIPEWLLATLEAAALAVVLAVGLALARRGNARTGRRAARAGR
jgi:hypothetical protein